MKTEYIVHIWDYGNDHISKRCYDKEPTEEEIKEDLEIANYKSSYRLYATVEKRYALED